MDKSRTANLLRFTVPQVLTASRLILGMFAICWAAQHQFDLAAKILVLGFMTDVFDGALARRLGVTSSFGLLLDRFADYLYYVVSPTCLVVFLLAEKAGLFSLLLLTSPTLGGALRYARGLARSDAPHPGLRGTPGLPTNVCAFYMLTLMFLWREQTLGTDSLRQIFFVTLPILTLLMAGRRRYPWLTDYLWILIPTAVGLCAMPFFCTTVLASITLGTIVIYVLFSPLLIPQHVVHAAGQTGGGTARPRTSKLRSSCWRRLRLRRLTRGKVLPFRRTSVLNNPLRAGWKAQPSSPCGGWQGVWNWPEGWRPFRRLTDRAAPAVDVLAGQTVPPRKHPMSLSQELIEALAVPALCRCLTGRPEDLGKLLVLEKIPYPSPVLRAFLKRLSRDLENGCGVFRDFLLRIGRLANPASREKLIANLLFHWLVKGAGIRTRIRSEGMWPPFLVAFSPTMRCNLKCTGCYSGLYSKDGELSEQELDRLFRECKELGDYFVVLTGGEPYLMKDSLLRLFRKHNDIFFLTFTNGTRFDRPLVDELAELGNVAPAISLEGFEHETDARRGAGVFARILRGLELLREKGVLFGLSVTYTSENVGVVADDRFIEFMLAQGALFAWYFMFMPIGQDPVLALVPSPEQRVRCGRRVAELRKKYGFFMADFWNDGPAVAGCLGGARRFMHVLNSGRVEACVFAHFGVDNIREKTLLEAANSPFFRAIREAFPYNQTGNLKRPCMIIDNPQVLRDLVDRFLVPQGHPHSEDIIRDPAVMKWVEDYAEKLKAVTEPEWLSMIENPESRWCKEKDEYKNLFTFGKMGGTSCCAAQSFPLRSSVPGAGDAPLQKDGFRAGGSTLKSLGEPTT